MYKILLATDRIDVQKTFAAIPWSQMNIRDPYIANSSKEAIHLLNTKAIDAVGMLFDGEEGKELGRFLHDERPSMAIFHVTGDSARQEEFLQELKDMLDALHTEYVDSGIDDDSIRLLLRDELTHKLLCGQLTDMQAAERKFKLIRAHISFTRTCVIYELDMPQGEIYISQHTNALERLERAIRNNFLGRDVDNIYYGVAVIAPRHIRVAAIPRGGEDQDVRDFISRADSHVDECIKKVEDYLDLDLSIREKKVISDLKSFFTYSSQY